MIQTDKNKQPSGMVLPPLMTEDEIHSIDMECALQIDFALGIEGYVRSEFIRLNSPPVSAGVVDERAAFEAHYHLFDLSRDTLSGAYVRSDVRTLWDAWQARAAQPDHSAQSVPDGIDLDDVRGALESAHSAIVYQGESTSYEYALRRVSKALHDLAAAQAPGKQEDGDV